MELNHACETHTCIPQYRSMRILYRQFHGPVSFPSPHLTRC